MRQIEAETKFDIMATLTKDDLIMILECILLKFEGQEMHKLLGYNIKYKHIMLADKTLEFIKEQWN